MHLLKMTLYCSQVINEDNIAKWSQLKMQKYTLIIVDAMLFSEN